MATINHKTYNEGTETFKDFSVYDGKDTLIFNVDGSAQSAAVTGTLSVSSGITSTGANTMLSASSSTQGLVVRGGSSIGTASTASGQILIGQTATYRGSIAYDDNAGSLYIDNLYNNNTGNIYFRTKTQVTAVEALTILGSGNVGIGTSAPTQKLHVYEASVASQAYLLVENNRTRNAAVYTKTTAGGFYAGTSIGTDTLCYQIYDAVAGERLRIDSSGNVGIGTSSLSGKLQIKGAAAAWNLFGEASDGSQLYGIYEDAGAAQLQLMDANGVAQINLQARAGQNNYINGGNVGIGTTSPATTLDVLGTSFLRGNVNAGKTSNINVTTAENGTGGGNREFETFTGASATGFTGTDSSDQGYGYFPVTIVSGRSYEVSATMVVTNGSPLIFITSTGKNFATDTVQTVQVVPVSGTTYRFVASGGASFFGIAAANDGGGMTCVVSNFSLKEVGSVLVTSDSNVGIGTTSPTEKLEVDGNLQLGTTVDAKLYMLSTGGNGNNERFYIEGYADGGTYGGGFKLYTRDDSNIFNTAVTVNRNGLVGIGTTTPQAKLDVTKAGKATIAVLDSTAFAAGVGGSIDLGGNYRTTGDFGTFTRIAAEKSNATDGNFGFDLGFYVTTNGGSTIGTKVATMTSTGVLDLTQGQIKFPATQVASADANTLDDYEEGGWSPQVYYQNATDQANATNVTQVGSYTKIGRLVTITCVLQWTITGSPAVDNIGVKNLPFASTAGTDLIWFGACQMVNAGSYPTDGYKIYMNQNSSLVLLYDDRTDAGNYGSDVGASGTKTLRFSFTYSAS